MEDLSVEPMDFSFIWSEAVEVVPEEVPVTEVSD